jgi:hypothetical protein
LYYAFEPYSLYLTDAIRAERKIRKITSTARGSEVAKALLPSVSSISLTPRLSQIYTITPLSNLIDSIVLELEAEHKILNFKKRKFLRYDRKSHFLLPE